MTYNNIFIPEIEHSNVTFEWSKYERGSIVWELEALFHSGPVPVCMIFQTKGQKAINKILSFDFIMPFEGVIVMINCIVA